MAYYRTCTRCGNNLDPGERCPCIDQELEEYLLKTSNRTGIPVSELVKITWEAYSQKEKTPTGSNQ